jgi:ankyrin repeat protein
MNFDILIENIILSNDLNQLKILAKEIGYEKIKANSDLEELAAIHWAAATSNIEITRFYLDEPISENPNLARNNNFTPLHAASMHGHWEVVKLLIEKGADVNIQTDPQGYAPIHSASFGGHLETVKLLVRNNARIDLRNYRNELPIDTAKRQNQQHIIAFFESL